MRKSCVALLVTVALILDRAAAQPPPPPLLPDAEVIARADSLPLDERRYLVYLYARLNQRPVAEALAEKLLARHPADPATLLALASLYADQKDAPAVLRTARQLLAADPAHPQARYFLAAGHYLAGDFAAAHRVLRELKVQAFAGRAFPFETDLAAAALAEGDWLAAQRSYEELLRTRPLTGETREEIGRALENIRREHRPRLELATAQLRLAAADIWRSSALHGRHLGDRHWLELRYARDDITLEAAPGLRAAREDREEFAANLATTHESSWRTDAWLGVAGAGALGGGRLGFVFAPQREGSIELAGNARATDSLALEALDGREDRATLAASWQLAADFTFATRAHARRVHLGHADLGRGAGLELNLDRVFRAAGPRLALGFRGAVAAFSAEDSLDPTLAAPVADPAGGTPARRAILDQLIARRINRHGTGLLLTDNLADAWLYRLTAGVDYDFELSATGWNAALALTFLARRDLALTAEAGYTSSAGASNAGSSATTLSFHLRRHF